MFPGSPVFQGKNYRITLLTDGLIRFEFNEKGIFEDRLTRRVVNRFFPEVKYTADEKDGILTLETDRLILRYTMGEAPAGNTLGVELKTKPYTRWHYGEALTNLGGTARTLDHVDGAVPLGNGVCSREGIALMDDSDGFARENGWFTLRNEETDFYIFAYGHDYRKALHAYFELTGPIPLLPAFALGNWWSRYHAYTQEEYLELIARFEKEQVPLSVGVIDMDWHYVADAPEESNWIPDLGGTGWTGYTWNEKLFPDYRAFLQEVKKHNLKPSLNLHPAQGVGFHEVQYPEMARRLGVDPASKKWLKLDLLNRDYMQAYFDCLMHPFEEEGVDFWWMDWQQGTDYRWIHDEEHAPQALEKKMDPLWILNELHCRDIARNGKRPIFFSRYAGEGSQRFTVGFSGDACSSWYSLAFQPYFTATASNAGYPWWSHDIGGHQGGYRDDELETRWVQFGCFSPILRLHSTNTQFTGKEPWKYRKDCELVQKDFLRLRQRLFPYLYTMNHLAASEGRPLISPMYYDEPEREEAYAHTSQYRYGTELLVAPITKAGTYTCPLGETEVWFPEGEWFDFFLGFRYEGNMSLNVLRFLEEYPVFAKAGAIVPLQDECLVNRLGGGTDMTAVVFPGASNEFTMIEDEGDGYAETATTRMNLDWTEQKATFTIHAPEGNVKVLPEGRSWTLCFRGFGAECEFKAEAGDILECAYDADIATWKVKMAECALGQDLVVTVTGANLRTDNAHAYERMVKIFTRAQVSNDWKSKLWTKMMNFGSSLDLGPDMGEVLRATKEMLKIWKK